MNAIFKPVINTFKSNIFKLITFLVGSILLLVGGVFYLLVTDLKFSNNSVWLFLAAITAFGAGICALLSENFRHKPTLFWVLKAVGFVLSCGFVAVLFIYLSKFNPTPEIVKTELFKLAKKQSKISKTAEFYSYLKTQIVICLVLAFTGMFAQILNVLSNAIYPVKD